MLGVGSLNPFEGWMERGCRIALTISIPKTYFESLSCQCSRQIHGYCTLSYTSLWIEDRNLFALVTCIWLSWRIDWFFDLEVRPPLGFFRLRSCRFGCPPRAREIGEDRENAADRAVRASKQK